MLDLSCILGSFCSFDCFFQAHTVIEDLKTSEKFPQGTAHLTPPPPPVSTHLRTGFCSINSLPIFFWQICTQWAEPHPTQFRINWAPNLGQNRTGSGRNIFASRNLDPIGIYALKICKLVFNLDTINKSSSTNYFMIS